MKNHNFSYFIITVAFPTDEFWTEFLFFLAKQNIFTFWIKESFSFSQSYEFIILAGEKIF